MLGKSQQERIQEHVNSSKGLSIQEARDEFGEEIRLGFLDQVISEGLDSLLRREMRKSGAVSIGVDERDGERAYKSMSALSTQEYERLVAYNRDMRNAWEQKVLDAKKRMAARAEKDFQLRQQYIVGSPEESLQEAFSEQQATAQM